MAKFTLTGKIFNLSGGISEILGQFKALNIVDVDPKLRKVNQIKSITSTCAIEGNSLNEQLVTDIVNNRRVIGDPREILEIKNALELYNTKAKLNYQNIKDHLKAHKILMKGLIDEAGQFRKTGVGITDGKTLIYKAPPAIEVESRMNELFDWINQEKDANLLIQSAVFHCEFETIHPFTDGNGRMGRFWQHLMLIQHHPIFRFVPVETIVHHHQQKYYNALMKAQRSHESAGFVEFSLSTIFEALKLVLEEIGTYKKTSTESRIRAFVETFKGKEFTRKDYLSFYKGIAGLSASRDLALGVRLKLLTKLGDKRLTRYKVIA